MNLLPYDSFQVESPFPLDETVALLKSRVEPRRLWRFPGSIHREFEGRVSKTKFRMTKVISGHNAFAPLITGQFLPADTGTLLQVRMGLRPITVLFMIVWLGGIGLNFIQGLMSGSLNTETASPLWVTVFMLVLGVAVPLGIFWYSATQQRKRLIEIFEGN